MIPLCEQYPDKTEEELIEIVMKCAQAYSCNPEEPRLDELVTSMNHCQINKKQRNYKTQFCRNENCEYGSKCTYAHLIDEWNPQRCKNKNRCLYKHITCWYKHPCESKEEMYNRLYSNE
mgnify:CR=1 FL=1|jgi:hypothetical protein